MTTPGKLQIPHRFRVSYSGIALCVEILLLIVIFFSIVNLISGIWMLLILALFFLTCIHFYRKDSVIRAFPPGSVIDVHQSPDSLKWIDNEHQIVYPSKHIKIFITRWFILLQLGTGKTRVSKLLLSDSFADINHYTYFRRHLIEMYVC